MDENPPSYQWNPKWQNIAQDQVRSQVIAVLSENKKVAFRKPFMNSREVMDFLQFLQRRWVKNIDLSLEDSTKIKGTTQAIWHSTFLVSHDVYRVIEKALFDEYWLGVAGGNSWEIIIKNFKKQTDTKK